MLTDTGAATGKARVCPDCVLWKGRVPKDCRCGGTRRLMAMDLMPRARELWTMMAEGDPALPAYAALDLLLNDLDGAAHRRGECVRLLWAAGAEWVEAASLPPEPFARYYYTQHIAGHGLAAVRRGAWTSAVRYARRLSGIAESLLAQRDFTRCKFAFEAARRIRHAARLVRDLKKCL